MTGRAVRTLTVGLAGRALIAAATYGLAALAGSPGWARWDTVIIVWAVSGHADYVVRVLGGRR